MKRLSRSRLSVPALVVLVGASLFPAETRAQEGFSTTGDFVFDVDGSTDAEAEIFVQGRGTAYLILSDEIESPLLIEPRSGNVQALNLLKVARQADGTVDLLTGASLGPVGAFTIDQDGIVFELDGRPAAFRNKPPYLGEGDVDDLIGYSSSYREGAEEYAASGPILRQLQEESRPVRVRVFFGSWCPYCQQVIPRILKVASELEGSGVALEFYGLPRDIHSDTEATRLDISGVPTGVVFLGDEEIGRISGGSWKIPELAIKNALDEAS